MNITLIQIAEQECTAQYKCYHKTSPDQEHLLLRNICRLHICMLTGN